MNIDIVRGAAAIIEIVVAVTIAAAIVNCLFRHLAKKHGLY